ncbi:MAG: metallophosphoesterase [Acidobacteriota bacterium]
MKIGVMADSHDHVPLVNRAVELFSRRSIDLLIHAGDFVAPFAVAPLAELSCPVKAVLGNNDGERIGLQKRFDAMGAELAPQLLDTEAGGRRIAAVHYPELATPIAASGRYDLVIYGHTHQIDIRAGEALLLNPGECGGWLSGRATVAIVDLDDMAVEILDLGH